MRGKSGLGFYSGWVTGEDGEGFVTWVRSSNFPLMPKAQEADVYFLV